ncbi:MAG: class I SAM-dependent methyltransferase [Saprospiraceae bacterium]|nr:class I SAM-dependent methyltransferase [Saprospiraceae bacterium]
MPRKLLSNQDLDWTAVVANNRMNRSRNAIGVNSYAQDLGFNPIQFLLKRAGKQEVRWLDLCCGEGNALIQAAEILRQDNIDFQLTGIDLVGQFSSIPMELAQQITLIQCSLRVWEAHGPFDLITIVHGLHYLGDKLGLLAKYVQLLKPSGIFIGHLDLQNIKIHGVDHSQTAIRNYFQQEKIDYQSRQHLLKLQGPSKIAVPFTYLGADVTAGPNYTGQESVTSVYEVQKY